MGGMHIRDVFLAELKGLGIPYWLTSHGDVRLEAGVQNAALYTAFFEDDCASVVIFVDGVPTGRQCINYADPQFLPILINWATRNSPATKYVYSP